MLVWSAPGWLFALAVIPLIWLMHRLTNPASPVMVSTLLFWKPVTTGATLARSHAKPNPLWMLRAAIAALIALAMAGPQWADTETTVVDVWFDDSFSMQTLENGTGRDHLAIDALTENLRQTGNANANIHSLSDPLRPPLILEQNGASDWAKQLERWIKIADAPIQAPLLGKNRQWLISDGADRALNDWLESSRIDRFLQIGDATDNSAVSLVSIRPHLATPGVLQVAIRLNHFGKHPDRRTLALYSGDDILESRELLLTPDQTTLVEFAVPRNRLAGGQILARFIQPDSLPQDDRLSLTAAMPIVTRVDDHCPKSIVDAVKAHPFLDESDAKAGPKLDIVCGTEASDPADAVIRFHHASQPIAIDETPIGLESGEMLNTILREQKHLAYFPNAQANQGSPVLVTGQAPLITLTPGTPRVVDCFIDMGTSDFAKTPEYPLLFAGLVDLALDRPLLDAIQQTSMPSEESRIAPEIQSFGAETNAVVSSPNPIDLAPYLLGMAMLLLLIDGRLSRTKP